MIDVHAGTVLHATVDLARSSLLRQRVHVRLVRRTVGRPVTGDADVGTAGTG